MWVRGMEIDLSEWTKNMKIFLSYDSVHQRMTSVEEGYYNLVDKMICFMDTSPSSAIPVIIQCVNEQSCHGDRDGSYTWTQQYGLLLNKIGMAMATTEYPVY